MRGEVLVVILNNTLDYHRMMNDHWYRIPIKSVQRWAKHFPPRHLAFYQTKKFGSEAYAVNYVAEVTAIREVTRLELLPQESSHPRRYERYKQIFFNHPKRLIRPIVSRIHRRIVFIETTLDKLRYATEINDLYGDSSLEDLLWKQLKFHHIPAERQVFIKSRNRLYYALDFQITCVKGIIDIEADGDFWHAYPEKAHEDNIRNNALQELGINVLRFNSKQIAEESESYCIPTIKQTINELAGIDEGGVIPRTFHVAPDQPQQLNLFEDHHDE